MNGFPRRGCIRWAFSVLVLILFVSSSVGYSSATSSHSSNPQTTKAASGGPVYVWLFGYVGNTFYPQTQLGLTPTQVLNVAKNLSNTFGKQNLVILTAVDEIQTYIDPNGVISSSMVPTIRSYVSQLKTYASAVYGRLDFLQYNVSAPSYGSISNPLSVYNQTDLYVNKLGLSGVWFDRSPSYYSDGPYQKPPGAGPEVFNQMMQNLTTLFPNANFILNQAASQFGPITPFANTTWEQHTFICPTVQVVNPGYHLEDNWANLPLYYARFPGHVLLHFDAQGPAPLRAGNFPPMAVFSNMSKSSENSLLQNLAINGTQPSLHQGTSYSIVYPILGSWTSWNVRGWPQYGQTLYNSLTIGKYHRSTYKSFLNIMKTYRPPTITLSVYSGSVGSTITMKGVYFSPGSVEIQYDNINITSVAASSSGTFSMTFTIPNSNSGRNNVTAYGGTKISTLAFYVK
jgi:hypothetical protein